jgi:hypothetical protein
MGVIEAYIVMLRGKPVMIEDDRRVAEQFIRNQGMANPAFANPADWAVFPCKRHTFDRAIPGQLNIYTPILDK